MNITSKVRIIKEALADKKGKDVVALDVTTLTVVADYFIIASAGNSPQVKALAESVDEKLSEKGILPLRRDGFSDCRWVVLDYGDVIVHIFKDEHRLMYALEELWAK
jgi:ribosome-associated protein